MFMPKKKINLWYKYTLCKNTFSRVQDNFSHFLIYSDIVAIKNLPRELLKCISTILRISLIENR